VVLFLIRHEVDLTKMIQSCPDNACPKERREFLLATICALDEAIRAMFLIWFSILTRLGLEMGRSPIGKRRRAHRDVMDHRTIDQGDELESDAQDNRHERYLILKGCQKPRVDGNHSPITRFDPSRDLQIEREVPFFVLQSRDNSYLWIERIDSDSEETDLSEQIGSISGDWCGI
jgi:hypothetical protein